MKKNVLFSILFISFIFFSCSTETVQWPETTQESKPWTRWWWMGNAVDQPSLARELKEFHDVGIGGVEITPIYGVKGEEDRSVEYLSPDFSDILKYTIGEVHRQGLGVDLPPGSGWRCGGPFVPGEKGLWSLRIQKTAVKKGEKWKLPADVKNAAAISFTNENRKVTPLNSKEIFTAPSNGTVYVALRLKKGDKVKRAADGGKGWAIDTFNKDITNWYLDEFWERLGIDESILRCFFHDSFEYTGDFTTHFTEEFKKRRGYDIANYLYVLAGDCSDPETVARVKSDYRETLSDLVLDSFIQPMTEWAHRHKSLNRNQAHGSPGNILDLYAACDIPETEIFKTVEPGSLDVFVNKFASSAAHVTGKKLTSSESFTWLNEHWTVTPADMVRATNRFFLAGINHMFFHGTCYSPEDAEWPGWLFYASTELNNRNPLWPEMPALFKYIQRSQSVLQEAKQQNDVLVYWPYYDVAASPGRIFIHLGVNKDAGWFINHPINKLSKDLMNAGYTFDYISEKQLMNCKTENGNIVTSGNTAYKAIVVPKTSYIPLETMQQLKLFIDAGGKVYFDERLPGSVPGMFEAEQREKQLEKIKQSISQKQNVGNVPKLLTNTGITGEKSIVDNGFHFLKMRMDNEVWYMIFNTGLEAKEAHVELNEPAKDYVFLNPMNGEITLPEQKGNTIRIQLEPERSILVKCAQHKINAASYIYEDNSRNKQLINGMWKIEFTKGGPVFPGNISTNKLLSWTVMGDEQAQRFSGTAGYFIEFDWQGKPGHAILNLGMVKDCAHVTLNGKDFGTLLGPTFKCKVDNLVEGKNTLEVEVTNVAANRIRDLDIRGVNWKKFYDINFVDIDYQPFDASGWEIKPAGLLGPVTVANL